VRAWLAENWAPCWLCYISDQLATPSSTRPPRFPAPPLRSLDAIHLATAEDLRAVLTWFVAYDKRLAEAARERALPVISPV
jgi:hypothetical protein